MFPIHFKLTIGTPEELARITAFIAGDYSAAVAAAPKLETKQPAAKAEALGKPKPTAASEQQTAGAPSPRTAESSPVSDPPAAPEQSAKPSETTTAPDAAATSAASDAPAFEYATLQKAVNERVAKVGKDKLLAIATKHGAKTFKDLPADKWALAHADVIALG